MRVRCPDYGACGFESHWAHWLISLVGVGLLIIEDYVPVVELVDTPDLGSGVLPRRVGSSPTGRTGGKCFLHFLLPLTLRSCYSVSERGSPDWLNW